MGTTSPMIGPLSATAATIPIEDIKQWRGQDVIDPADEKLGKLEAVFYDTEKHTPAFAAVKSGVFGLTIEDEAEAYHYFGLVYPAAGEGARRLAKH
jgi:hypothetical protein